MGLENELTDKQIIEIYEYCIGGCNILINEMRIDVYKFLQSHSGINTYINNIKRIEFNELSLNGYFDY